MDFAGWGAQRWANHLTRLLDAANPPNRYAFDVGTIAIETSHAIYPEDPVTLVHAEEIEGFDGALVPAESGKRWGIIHRRGQSRGRTRFTVAHEFGHYLLHRRKYPNGIHSDEASVDGRTRMEIEREANEFASFLLMPFDDFRRQIGPRDKPDFPALAACADRYDVSLVAATLRWLRYTERRALIVVSTDGFVNWAWSSDPALKSGCFIRTSRGPVPVPARSSVGQGEFTAEAKAGMDRPGGVWFDEPVRELTFRSDKYDCCYTLLHLGLSNSNVSAFEPQVEGTYDRFLGFRRQ